MSEHISQRQHDEHENSHFDDPLAELARIVSGEEPETKPVNTMPESNVAEPQSAKNRDSDSLESNPFAKYIVSPVNTAETTEQPSASEVAENVDLLPEEPETATQKQAAPVSVDNGPVSPEQNAAMMETEIQDIDSGNIATGAGDDSMDLESQLMAELNSEEDVYDSHRDKKNPPIEDPLNTQQSQLQPEQPVNLSAVEQQIGQPALDLDFESSLEQNLEQSLEQSLEQNLELVSEPTVETGVGYSGSGGNHGSDTEFEHPTTPDLPSSINVDEEIDAVLDELKHPVKIAQNSPSNKESLFDQQDDGGNNEISSRSVERSMDTMSAALAGNVDMQTELPEFPAPKETVAPVQAVPSAGQSQDPYLHKPAPDYSQRERQIDDSVHALQDDLIDSLDIENAFSDAFATELSMEMEPEEPVSSHPHQPSFVEQSVYRETLIEDDLEELMSSDEIIAGAAGIPVGESVGVDNTPPATGQNQLEIDPAMVGDLQEDVKKGSGFRMAAAALGIAVLTGAGVVAYGLISDTNSTGVPVLVRADQSDFKVKPEQPGGKEFANQDQPVYVKMTGDKSNENNQQKLVSSSEKPVELETKVRSLRPEKSVERLTTTKQTSVQNTTSAFVQPRKVKTVTVRADGTIMTSTVAQSNNLGVVPPENNNLVTSAQLPVAQVPASAVKVENSNVEQVGTIDGAKSTGTIAIPSANPFIADKSSSTAITNSIKSAALDNPVELPSNSPTAVTPKPVAVKPVNTLTTATTAPLEKAPKTETKSVTSVAALASKPPVSNTSVSSNIYKVQISSQRSMELAEATYENLKQKFADLLSGYTREIRAVDVDGKGTFYRVQIPVGEMPEAASFCKRYKAAGGSCFVTR
ncbi:MAG: hypothetical protein GY742_21200 [Hyphomicrobiales bacterium]|nr:hypothetical protein [Hyphomicrobiales bacterium]